MTDEADNADKDIDSKKREEAPEEEEVSVKKKRRRKRKRSKKSKEEAEEHAEDDVEDSKNSTDVDDETQPFTVKEDDILVQGVFARAGMKFGDQ